MDDQIYVRLRGRIVGPFTIAQLHSLAKKGQFGRSHEVSTDRVTWSRAAERPELFPTSKVDIDRNPPALDDLVLAAGDADGATWYYHQNGSNYGPISFADLQNAAQSGRISAADLVWQKGMAEWTAASTIPGLPLHQIPPPPPFQSATAAATTRPCPFCTEEISFSAIKCKHCGSLLVPLPGMSGSAYEPGQVIPGRSTSDPLLMAFLSGCCITGLGQIVMGQTAKGVIILFVSIACALMTSGLSIFLIAPFAALDAYLIGKKLRSGHAVGNWECF